MMGGWRGGNKMLVICKFMHNKYTYVRIFLDQSAVCMCHHLIETLEKGARGDNEGEKTDFPKKEMKSLSSYLF